MKRVLALASAPLLMYLLSAVERRRGAALAGLLGAAPFTIVLVVLGTGDTDIARHAGAHVVAQVPFFLVLAALVHRGLHAGLLAASAAFAAVSLVAAAAGPLAATVAGVLALALGARASTSTTSGGGTRRSPALGAAVATGLVGLTMLAAALAGPAAAGTIAAFPALSGAFALTLARDRGPQVAAAALHGGVRGLRSYLAFCVATPALGVGAGLAVAVAVTAVGGAAPAGRGRRLTRPTEGAAR